MMRNATPAAAWVLASVACSACSGAASPATIAVADSAGVRIVTNLPGSIGSAEERSLSEEPVADIGSGANPDVVLFRVASVVPLDGGRVAVGMNGPPQVQVFEPDGTLAATLGREGEGPGEFHAVGSVVPLGADSLAVWDPHRRRMSVFTGDGRFAREVDLSALALLTPIASPNAFEPAAWTYLLPSGQGSLVLFQVGTFGPGQGVRRVEVPSFRTTLGGDELARLGPFPGQATYMSSETGIVPYPFGATTYGTPSGSALVVGTAETTELRYYAAEGALERIVRWPDHDRVVAEGPLLSEFDTWLDAQLAQRAPGERAMLRGLLDAIPLPERFPAYDGIISGDAGEIWVGEYPGQLGLMGLTPEVRRVPDRRWLVFGAEGAFAATVRTPEGFEPHAVRAGRVWGVFRDDLFVESVRAYEVVGK